MHQIISKKLGRWVRILAVSILFLTVFVLILFGVSYLFMPKNNLAEFGMEDVTANGILGERDNSIDVLVIGDSEAYSAISPMEIWQKHGITSYVCATSGQKLSVSDTFLKQAFKRQKPKVVILETDAIYRDIPANDAILTRIQNLFSVFRYHNRWKTLRSDELFTSVEYTWTDDHKGFVYNGTINGTDNTEYMIPTDSAAPIKALNQQYVKAMAAYCKANGATFLLVSTPSTVNWNYERHNGVAQLADSCGVTYIDLNLAPNKVDIDWSTDTRDKGDHLNYNGAVKVSAWLGEYLKEHFDLSDHREDSDYSKWNEALTRYQKAVTPAAT